MASQFAKLPSIYAGNPIFPGNVTVNGTFKTNGAIIQNGIKNDSTTIGSHVTIDATGVSYYLLSGSGLSSVDFITSSGFPPGQRLLLRNATGSSLTLTDVAGVNGGMVFITGADVVMPNTGFVELLLDPSHNFWFCINANFTAAL